MNSFYGGPSGQSFEIEKVFTSRKALLDDLELRWTSDIGVGSYVFVSYGMPGTDKYNTNREIDSGNTLDNGQTYNSTLWQKIYLEEASTTVGSNDIFLTNKNYGLGYKLITSCTGNTPDVQIKNADSPLNADEDPYIEAPSNKNLDVPIFTIHLPQSQILSMLQTEVLNANVKPSVTYNDDDINHPTVRFHLPQSQVLQQGQTTPVHNGVSPSFTIDNTDINKPVINFSIPIAQTWVQGETTVLAADGKPSFSLITSEDNPDFPTLNFSLPQSQVMVTPNTNVLSPSENPNVEFDPATTVNNPKLLFSLPRAVKFYYGSKLGLRKDGTYTSSDSDLMVCETGDYYINQETGFIYLATAKNSTEITFQYQACLQAPEPSVPAATIISAFDDKGNKNNPSVTASYTDEEEKKGWTFNFSLPSNPDIKLSEDSGFIGAGETGTLTLEVKDRDSMELVMKIAQGSRIFNSENTAENMVIEGSKIGDVCLNTETGEFYEKISDTEWKVGIGTLKGPKGSPLNIVEQYQFSGNAEDDTLDKVSTLIMEQRNELPSASEIIAVVYTDETGSSISYWYFYTRDPSYSTGSWGRVQLTGGVSNLIENPENQIADDDNKAYSVTYVNKLTTKLEKEIVNKRAEVYSKKETEDLITWGKFSDLIED